jgi:hypothetical protein
VKQIFKKSFAISTFLKLSVQLKTNTCFPKKVHNSEHNLKIQKIHWQRHFIFVITHLFQNHLFPSCYNLWNIFWEIML